MMNPYESPPPEPPLEDNRKRRAFFSSVTCLFSLMVALNFSRLIVTWHAFRTDGFEQIGFPFAFFERGGFSFHYVWHLQWLFVDAVIAFTVAVGCGYLLRDGWIVAFRRLRKWGLEEVD
ncbi:hypothetical protein SH528x_004497 [Novipirellula sp. SH528]|uniref:hypothetical protein n=1 Tax=Novipirellula sp. SH528 TaxID=3454466 RepID=UPI003FA0E645